MFSPKGLAVEAEPKNSPVDLRFWSKTSKHQKFDAIETNFLFLFFKREIPQEKKDVLAGKGDLPWGPPTLDNFQERQNASGQDDI